MSAYDIRKQTNIKKKAKKEACVNGVPVFNGYQVLNDIIGKIGENLTFAEPEKIDKRKKKCKKSGIQKTLKRKFKILKKFSSE